MNPNRVDSGVGGQEMDPSKKKRSLSDPPRLFVAKYNLIPGLIRLGGAKMNCPRCFYSYLGASLFHYEPNEWMNYGVLFPRRVSLHMAEWLL